MIPDDVRKVAREYANEWRRDWQHCLGGNSALEAAFEAAILAERERCAGIAEQYTCNNCGALAGDEACCEDPQWDDVPYENIAAAIRQPGGAEGAPAHD